MKIEEAISMADYFKNNNVNSNFKLKMLNDVELSIICEMGGDPSAYRKHTSLSDELALSSPYSKIYVFALLAMISLAEGENAQYSSYMKQYENALHTYAKHILRKR